jgi:hypothetical protein
VNSKAALVVSFLLFLFKKAPASTFFMSTVAGGDGANYAVNLINMLETRIHVLITSRRGLG